MDIKGKMILVVFSILFLTSCNFNLKSPHKPNLNCKIIQVNYKGWKDSYLLTNGIIRLVVVPSIGRIMEYSLIGEKNIIYQDNSLSGKLFPCLEKKGHWYNYGGDKLWIAPEKASRKTGWYYSFDNCPWKVENISSSEIYLIGPPVSPVGIRFSRKIKIYPDSSRVKIVETMENISNHSVSWSIWDVTQVIPSGTASFPLSKDKKVNYWPRTDPKNGQYNLKGDIFYVYHQGKNGKVGAVSPGWIAYSIDNLIFTKRFTYFPGEVYPDNNSSVEVYTCKNYVEIEILSPIKRLKPGEKYSFIQNWYLEHPSARKQK